MPQRLASASRGVKVSPLPVPSNLKNLTPDCLRKAVRWDAIKKIAIGIAKVLTRQK